MQYTTVEKQMPTYYRASYKGEYRPLHRVIYKLSSDPVNALHYHECMELGICLAGSGVNYIADRRYDYRQGDLQVVPAGVPHLSKAGEGETRWVWISLSPQRLLHDGGFIRNEAVAGLLKKCFAGVFHPREYPETARLIERIRLLPEPVSGETEMELVFLVGQLLVECARMEMPERACRERAASRKLRPALDYIREHYADREAMTEARIAGVCGMSVSHFRAVFRKETDMGVKQYVIRTRLAAAAHLLRQTEMSILQIAYESGFGQVSSFNRSFRKVYGQTPSKFRKGAGEA